MLNNGDVPKHLRLCTSPVCIVKLSFPQIRYVCELFMIVIILTYTVKDI